MISKKLQHIVGVLKEGLVSIYLYQKGNDSIPVFVVKEVNFVFLDSIRSFFAHEKFIILTEDDIHQGHDVFCLKYLHIRNHSELFYGDDVFASLSFEQADFKSALELEIRNKRIQLREDYLSQDKGKAFLQQILPGMHILWEGALFLKYADIKIPQDMKALLSLFDVAWSCNSHIFYYLIDDTVDKEKIPFMIHSIHHYLSELCTKINHYSL